MSFLYPRTISITRPGPQSGIGAQPYGGQVKSTETTIATGLPAAVQHKTTRGRGGVGLPGDASYGTRWLIFFTGPAAGAVQNRDIVTDDIGRRFQIVAAYWTPLAWNCESELLEA